MSDICPGLLKSIVHSNSIVGSVFLAKERGKRVYRKATSEERARHTAIRQQIKDELPEIKNRAKQRLSLLKKEGTPLRQILGALRAERQRQGLSLADINERTGIDRAALSRLENNEEANPTLATLERYAEAIGKQVVVILSEPSN
jgi:DNA-binding Xre family transcriptional regulator